MATIHGKVIRNKIKDCIKGKIGGKILDGLYLYITTMIKKENSRKQIYTLGWVKKNFLNFFSRLRVQNVTYTSK